MESGAIRKRTRPDMTTFNANGGIKKSKEEMESFPTGVGSKSKPCTKFFSTSGCPFGEGCHFLHYVPGGIKAASQMLNIINPGLPPAARNATLPPSYPDGSSPPAVKTRLCNKYNTAEGCRFGEKCHFAHGEWELGKPTAPSFSDPRAAMPPIPTRMGRQMDAPLPHNLGPASSFGASATAKISIDASLTGAIIGKNGINSKQITRVTGAKLCIRDHETDPGSKNIELEGTFDQIKQASAMVRELIMNVAQAPASSANPLINQAAAPLAPSAGNNFKTKLCENFAKGSCTFGDRCHFAHGSDELRKYLK